MPQPTLFTKPLTDLRIDDVNGLIGWPESLTVEFKEDLPGRDGRKDSWHGGGSVENYAKEKLFKELIALANTAGGHLILGVAESATKPAVAEKTTPLPRCAELADALRRACQAIDPPIPLLGVQPIMVNDTEAGIVVFRVPESRSAPHRNPFGKECYIRRADESVPIGMREIQDMMIRTVRRDSESRLILDKFSADFAEWLQKPHNDEAVFCGVRISAVPIGAAFDLGRLYVPNYRAPFLKTYFGASRAPGPARAVQMIGRLDQSRPIMRGVRLAEFHGSNLAYMDLTSSGCVTCCARMGVLAGGPWAGKLAFSLIWIVSYLVNVILGADHLRNLAGYPDCEYAIELEISSSDHSRAISLGGVDDDDAGLIHGQSTLPRISFGPLLEIENVVNEIFFDLYDAAGAYPFEVRRSTPIMFSSLLEPG